MLKLTYTENKLSLDYLKQSLEDWINTRMLVSIRSTTSIHIESSTASILVPASCLTDLRKISSENIVELCHCDAESIEVVLKGIWVTSKLESETGVFVTEFVESTEYLLYKMFNCKFCYI